METAVFIATSLDGFIARPDGEIDWLVSEDEREGEEDYGYAAFMAGVDCIIMGRATFEQVLSFDEWAYGDTRMIVLSNTLWQVPDGAPKTVEMYSGGLAELLERLEAEGHERAYVDGGVTIRGFLREGLLTDLTITTLPVLIGEGRPLFGPLGEDVALRHVRTQAYANGFVQSVYEVLHENK
jgi:dihydrofolate reductase